MTRDIPHSFYESANGAPRNAPAAEELNTPEPLSPFAQAFIQALEQGLAEWEARSQVGSAFTPVEAVEPSQPIEAAA